MKYINIDEWTRKEHFKFFQERHNPRLSVTAQVDVGCLILHRNNQAKQKPRFTDYVYYSIMKCANMIPEFRTRLVNLRPVEFKNVNAAFTYVPSGSTLHSNCICSYNENFRNFIHNVQTSRDEADKSPTLTPPGGEGQALIYMSSLRDVTFTSLSNPWGDPWIDTVPRIIFGKFNPDTNYMPVAIEALHSFIDGTHISTFLQEMGHILQNPSEHFSTAEIS